MARLVTNNDIIVIGASAGGLEALMSLTPRLPANLPASVFIVMHIGKTQSQLAQILSRAGPLPATDARNGEEIRLGHIYAAVPDRHLLLHDGHILLRRGPHENLTRPAIDPLFRSAACSYGSRVVGVVLSGDLNDGTAGLLAIKRCGGIAVVQDPADALAPSMPRSAQRHMGVDYAVPARAMGELLTHLAAAPAGRQREIPMEIRLEAAIAAQELNDVKKEGNRMGNLSSLSCHEGGGALWELADGGMLRYRCHVGHAYTADAMLAAENDETKQLLSRLLRSHRDRAELARRMAEQERVRQHCGLAGQLQKRAQEYEENAELMQRLLQGHGDALKSRGGPSMG